MHFDQHGIGRTYATCPACGSAGALIQYYARVELGAEAPSAQMQRWAHKDECVRCHFKPSEADQ